MRISNVLNESLIHRFIETDQDTKKLMPVSQDNLAQLNSEMRKLLKSFSIVKIKIYNSGTRIVYSTEPKLIGQLSSDNSNLARALSGMPVSERKTKVTSLDLEGEKRRKVQIIKTYVPMYDNAGIIIGCFEIHKDVTNELVVANSTLSRAKIVLTVTVLGIFSALMFVIYRSVQTINSSTVALQKSESQYKGLSEELEVTVEKLGLSNRELQDLSKITAHDLKAPLRAIGTLSSWIFEDYSDKHNEEGKEYARLLTKRAERMSALIDSVLEYSEAGRSANRKGVVKLDSLLAEVINDLSALQNIEINVKKHLPIIKCERGQIRQVFHNLIGNAVKYMDKPQGTIEIDCIEEDGFWKFSVTDNGPGIEEKHFEKIFQIFQTLKARDEFESIGIGLAIAKKIVEVYDGKIWVESEQGKTSTFFFTLPKHQDDILSEAELQTSVAV